MLITRAGPLVRKFAGRRTPPSDPLFDTGEPYASTPIALSLGDTRATLGSSSGYSGVKWAKDLTGRKVYAEVTITAVGGGSNHFAIGVCDADYSSGSPTVNPPGDAVPGASWRNNGTLFRSEADVGIGSFTTADVLAMAVDCSTGAFTVYKNNSSAGTGTLETFNALTRWRFCAWFYQDSTGASVTINTTQTYSTPSGFNWIGDIPD